jgi:RimJ/RimL family protein N-acetyltransferase
VELDLDGLRLRPLSDRDAPLLVEATRQESGRSLWGPHPVGPYAPSDARSALRAWDPGAGQQRSYGLLRGARLIGALGLMPDGPGSAELAYWVRPEERGHGIAARAVRSFTGWAHDNLGIARLWLEINPENAPSLRVAQRSGYLLEQRLPRHCRSWTDEDPEHDTWHDCLVWIHIARPDQRPGSG